MTPTLLPVRPGPTFDRCGTFLSVSLSLSLSSQCESLLDLLSVLENTGLPGFICRFLGCSYSDSITHVEFAGAERGQFLMARGVRQGCPASGFLFAMAFDPIFRWLHKTIIPRNFDNLDFLQPAQCAYADDLAVASPSFRELMYALAPAFRSVDCIIGLNLNYRKC